MSSVLMDFSSTLRNNASKLILSASPLRLTEDALLVTKDSSWRMEIALSLGIQSYLYLIVKFTTIWENVPSVSIVIIWKMALAKMCLSFVEIMICELGLAYRVILPFSICKKDHAFSLIASLKAALGMKDLSVLNALQSITYLLTHVLESKRHA